MTFIANVNDSQPDQSEQRQFANVVPQFAPGIEVASAAITARQINLIWFVALVLTRFDGHLECADGDADTLAKFDTCPLVPLVAREVFARARK